MHYISLIVDAALLFEKNQTFLLDSGRAGESERKARPHTEWSIDFVCFVGNGLACDTTTRGDYHLRWRIDCRCVRRRVEYPGILALFYHGEMDSDR